MKRSLVIFFLLTSMSLLMGQPVTNTDLTQKKLEAEHLPDMTMPRAGHTSFYANGELTVVGGHTSGFVLTPTAEYFSEGSWHTMPSVYPHDNGMAVVMNEGQRVLIAGGHEKNLGIGQSYEVEMYYPASHSFEGFGCLDRKRALAQGVELDSGRVLVTGNHKGDDSFEMFDGQRFFRHVKDVAVWRSVPYVLPIAPDDAIAFGAVWREQGFKPCDTVDRLKGEPFCVPLLKEWMPLLYDQNSHAQAAFIGDKTTGDYSYIIAAQNISSEIAFILVHDTIFSLISTIVPVPSMTQWGRIKYDRTAIADRHAHRAYLVGNDTTGRAYVVAVEYDKQPAPLTLYYTDPLSDFGNTTPVLTPDGNLVVTGGITDDNFAPFASVWLLHTGERKMAAMTETPPRKVWPWVLCGLLAVAVVIIIRAKRHENTRTMPVKVTETEPKPEPQQETNNELMSRITQLMETQQLYLNPELKVTDVAEALGVHRNAVSACINAQGSTFSQWVNDYRLQHAKNLLLENSDMKISAVALESGFANERSFFRVFKDATGMTPKEWTAQQQSVS
ncbi:MAG: helix-turn-helix domain-containing protein [Bacteroidales bacterium]|nr:helix-turn-helix domain-containing protein [Bacteroidales bacterium]